MSKNSWLPLSAVYLSRDVFLVCLNHALTTEREEMMGLLLGDIKQTGSKTIAFIHAVAVLTRSYKRPDRVEIDPEQLTAATAEAEKIAASIKTPTRVIGWYHSHPHITVLPSHVDVRTQASYQKMDKGFVGLIISCFNADAALNGRIQMIAFQSLALDNKPPEEVVIPLHLVPAQIPSPNTLTKMVDLQKILFEEGKSTYYHSLQLSQPLHPFSQVHNSAVYTKALCRLLEYGCTPLTTLLDDRHKQNLLKLKQLQKLKEELLKDINK